VARFAIAAAAGISLVACSAILGLTDPTTDNSIGAADGSGGNDGSNSDGAANDGNTEAASSCPGVNLTSDPENCGACNHSCLGSTCTNSACDPILLVDDPTLAPRYMVEDTTSLYFTNARSDLLLSSVAKASKTGVDGSAAHQILGQFGDADGGNFKITYPYEIAIAGTKIFVALTADEYSGNDFMGGVAQCSTTSCPTDIADNLTFPNLNAAGVASDGTIVAYGYDDLTNGSIGSDKYEVRTNILADNSLLSSPVVPAHVNFIVSGTSGFYVGADDGITSYDESGNFVATLTTVEADQMALSENVIYFTSTLLPDDGAAQPTVQSVPTTGGTPTILASGSFLFAPAGIAVDTANIYIADPGDLSTPTDGHVYRCPLSGCGTNGSGATILSTGASSGNNPRTVVAGDKDAIYWGNRYGQIWKQAK
jgi:hypothetical protein